jgi:hypothetical protein
MTQIDKFCIKSYTFWFLNQVNITTNKASFLYTNTYLIGMETTKENYTLLVFYKKDLRLFNIITTALSKISVSISPTCGKDYITLTLHTTSVKFIFRKVLSNSFLLYISLTYRTALYLSINIQM